MKVHFIFIILIHIFIFVSLRFTMDAITALTTQYYTQHTKTASVLAIIGLLMILRKFIKFFSAIYKILLRPRRNFKKRYG